MSLDFLRKNLGLKIFSLILAITLWSYVKYTSTPQAIMTSEAQFKVPLEVENLAEKLVALEAPPDVTVTARGGPNTLSRVRPGHFRAYINLSNKKAGLYNVPVKVTTPPDVEKIRVEPDTVTIRIDPLEKRLMSVKVKTRGTAASGFILGKMTSEPNSVMVIGAQSKISGVHEVRAVCNIEGANEDLVQRVLVEAVDSNGKVVDHLKLQPEYVRATVQIKNEIANATVPIVPNIEGSPAPGYKIEKITLNPPTATIQYRHEIDTPPTSLKTEKIEISGIKASVAKDIGIVLPREVSLVEPESVGVHVKIIQDQEDNQ